MQNYKKSGNGAKAKLNIMCLQLLQILTFFINMMEAGIAAGIVC